MLFRNLLPFFAPDEGGGGDPPASDPPPSEPEAAGPDSLLGTGEPPAEPPKDGEPPAGGEPPQEPAKRAPEEYTDFASPEGLKLDEATIGDFKTLAKEMNLSQEQAQKLLEFGGGKLKAQLEAPYQVWRGIQEKWQQEVKADSEIGGVNYDASIRAAGEVFKPGPGNPLVQNEADAQSLRQALNVTGAGNNPAVVKFFVRLGKVLSEPASLMGKAPKGEQADLLRELYPTMFKDE
jgi:hypothetical protein